ncbi:MAG: ABC transporter ATP-binding protein [Thiotrichales bacterium]
MSAVLPLLEVRDLRTYLRAGKREVTAVDGVSFAINQGETFCLVGESGSGKSISALSVIRLLPRIAHHPSGEIWFNYTAASGTPQRVNMLELPEARVREIRGSNIAMIFQEPMTSLNPVFTVGEQIIEALQLHNPGMMVREATERARLALEQVQIRDAAVRMGEFPHRLSGGQRQRVMIAMAMACEPELLIADEPTTALDVTVQAEILRLMRKLQDERGMSILFITHDFGVVSEMADRVAVMRHGVIVEDEPLRAVIRTPRHDYTRSLLAALPENLPRVAERPAQAGDDQPLVQVENLKVYFPVRKGVFRRVVDHVRAVDDVSVAIRAGEIVALVGESGCGKTTLGRAILRLTEPTAGLIQFDGRAITTLPRREMQPFRREMQVVFQDPASSLNPRLTVATILTEPMRVHGIGADDDERLELAAQVLERVQLERDHLWRYPHEFSGGQRQRIGIARALALNPRFIVCDEITSALDVSVQAEILQLLLTLRAERNLAMLFITHNISVVEYLSDRILVMRQGRVVETGDTDQVSQHPREAYTRELMQAVPRLRLDSD